MNHDTSSTAARAAAEAALAAEDTRDEFADHYPPYTPSPPYEDYLRRARAIVPPVPAEITAVAAEYDAREGLDGCFVTVSGCPYCGDAHAYCFLDCEERPETFSGVRPMWQSDDPETYPCTGEHQPWRYDKPPELGGKRAVPPNLCPCTCDYCRLNMARNWRETAELEVRSYAAHLWREDYLNAHPEQRQLEREFAASAAAGVPAWLEDGSINPDCRAWPLLWKTLTESLELAAKAEREKRIRELAGPPIPEDENAERRAMENIIVRYVRRRNFR